MAVKKKKVNKWRNKDWYTLEAPEMFERKEIGGTPAEEEDNVIGRVIKVPLDQITNKRSHRNTIIDFKVKEIEGGKAKTEIKGFEISRSYIRKNIRKRKSIIKTVKDLETDGIKLHTTAYAFTVRNVHSSQKKKIREIINRKLEEEAEKNDFNSLIQKMIFGKTATEIFRETKEISPIKRIEITKCEVERGE